MNLATDLLSAFNTKTNMISCGSLYWDRFTEENIGNLTHYSTSSIVQKGEHATWRMLLRRTLAFRPLRLAFTHFHRSNAERFWSNITMVGNPRFIVPFWVRTDWPVVREPATLSALIVDDIFDFFTAARQRIFNSISVECNRQRAPIFCK